MHKKAVLKRVKIMLCSTDFCLFYLKHVLVLSFFEKVFAEGN